MKSTPFDRLVLSDELKEVLCCVETVFPESRDHLLELAYQESDEDLLEVAYEVPGQGRVVEAQIEQAGREGHGPRGDRPAHQPPHQPPTRTPPTNNGTQKSCALALWESQ